MQKKLIALAIAGLASTGAFAQTNVTIYGVVDMAYGNFDSNATRGAASGDYQFSGIASGGLSGPRLGFKAEEDLGGGLKAGTVLEFGTLSPDGGAASGAGGTSGLANSRQTYLFLSSASMGTFQMGRLYNPGTNTAAGFDVEGASTFGPITRITTNMGLAIDAAGGNAARQNNSIGWLSPKWSGFSAQLQYSFGENGEAGTNGSKRTSDGDTWGLGLNYANGPLALGFVYSDASNFGGQSKTAGAAPGIDVTEWFVGGSYDFGMLKLAGSYQDFDIDNTNNLASGDTSNGITASNGARAKSSGDIWNVGVIVPVFKAGSVRVSYASLSRTMKNNLGVKTNGDADGWGISYQHAMSKRTTAYVGYVDMSNDRGSQIRAANVVSAPGAGQDSSGFAMGMRHTF